MNNNLCFVLLEDNGIQKLVCAHETDTGEGVYLGTDVKEFSEMPIDKQVDKINSMIIAVREVVNVKRGIKFSDYQR